MSGCRDWTEWRMYTVYNGINITYFMRGLTEDKCEWYTDGLVQERRNPSALAMGLCLSCTNTSIQCQQFGCHRLAEVPLRMNTKMIRLFVLQRFRVRNKENTKLLVYYKLQGNSVETYALSSAWPEIDKAFPCAEVLMGARQPPTAYSDFWTYV